MTEQLKEAYEEVAADRAGLQVMLAKDAKRIINFTVLPYPVSNA
jgi:hypothetical protein